MKNYFQGKVLNGGFSCKEWYNWLAKQEEKRIEVFAAPITNKRSESQNALWWPLIVRTICEHIGEQDEWKIHRLLEKKLIPKDHITIKGKTEEIQKTCSELKVGEFSAFIEDCKNWAAENLDIRVQAND